MQQPIYSQSLVKITARPAKRYALYLCSLYLLAAMAICIVAVRWHVRFLAFTTLPFIVIALYKYLYTCSFAWRITEQQIICESGIFVKTTQFLEMYRIRDFIITQSIPSRLMKLMDITLLTFDHGEPLLIMSGIPQSDLAQTIRDYVQKSRQNNRVLTVDG